MPTATLVRPARPTSALTRRSLFQGLGALGAVGALSACAPKGPTEAGSGAATTNSVEHLRGVTEVPADPQRVVTVGYSDQDPLLALGVRPVGVTDWYGDHPYATWPWAQEELGDAQPTVLNKGTFTGTPDYQYEQIAALEPDLILGLYTTMKADEYDRLSSIAPTVGPPKDYPEFTAPWEATTRLAGQALGRADLAEEKIADVQELIKKTREEHPEFEGKVALVAERSKPGSSFVRSPGDPRSQLLAALGFVIPDDIAPGETNDGSTISDEQMGQLDRDVLLWNVGTRPEARAELEGLGLYRNLKVTKAGHSLFIEDPMVSGAWTWGTVLSLPSVVEALAALIAPALR